MLPTLVARPLPRQAAHLQAAAGGARRVASAKSHSSAGWKARPQLRVCRAAPGPSGGSDDSTEARTASEEQLGTFLESVSSEEIILGGIKVTRLDFSKVASLLAAQQAQQGQRQLRVCRAEPGPSGGSDDSTEARKAFEEQLGTFLQSISSEEIHADGTKVSRLDLDKLDSVLAAQQAQQVQDLRDELRAGSDLAATLNRAALQGFPEVVREAIAAGADVNADEGRGVRPLFAALDPRFHPGSETGQLECMRLLLEAGAAPHIVLESERDRLFDAGSTLLHMAAQYGWARAVQELLGAGCDIAARNAYGRTPLHVAAQEVNGEWEGEFEAIYRGKAEVVRALVAAGADPNAVDDQGNTPLHVLGLTDYMDLTVFEVHEELVAGVREVAAALLEGGADPKAVNARGETPPELLLALYQMWSQWMNDSMDDD